MASAPQPALPLFFNDLMPINSRDHITWKSKNLDNAKFLAATHAVPLTIDEFVDAQRSFPIIFTAGNDSVPLALMGLNEGVNTYVDRSEEHTSELQSLMRISYAVFCLQKKKKKQKQSDY